MWVVAGCRDNSRGSALVELSLVIPVLLVFFMGTVNIGRILEVREQAGTLGRELANISYRECRAIESSTEKIDCIKQYQSTLKDEWRGKYPWSSVTSVYRCEDFSCIGAVCSCGGTIQRVAHVSSDPSAPIAGKYSEGRVAIELGPLLNQVEEIYIAEVYMGYPQKTGYLSGGQIYGVTIY